jgi:peptide/nickel transport system substrate-binding protein
MTMQKRSNGWALVGASVLVTLGMASSLMAEPPFVFALLGAQPMTSLDNLEAPSKTRLLVEAQIMEGLVRFNRSNDHLLEPRLAANYHRIDSRTYVFRMRKGVILHPHNHGARHHEEAEQVTAEDVAFSLMRAKESPGAKEARLDNLETVQAVGPDLVKIKLAQPDDDLPYRLATAMGHITCRRYYEGLGRDEASRKAAFALAPIGTGPYRLARPLGAAGQGIVLERFEGYWDRDWVRSPEAIARVEFRYFGSPAAIVEGLKRGEVSMASLMLSVFGSGGLLGARKSDLKLGGIVRLQPPYLSILAINLSKPELADAPTRRLLNAAVHKTRIEEICPQAKGDLPGGYTSYLEIARRYLKAPDPLAAIRWRQETEDKLKQLKARGPLIILTGAGEDAVRDDILNSVARDLETELGLKVTFRRSDRLRAEIASPNRSYDLVYTNWTPDTPGERDGLSILRPLFSSASRDNFSHYSDSQVDQIFAQLQDIIDEPTAQRLYNKIVQLLLSNPPHIWLACARSEALFLGTPYRAKLKSPISIWVYYSGFLKDIARRVGQ